MEFIILSFVVISFSFLTILNAQGTNFVAKEKAENLLCSPLAKSTNRCKIKCTTSILLPGTNIRCIRGSACYFYKKNQNEKQIYMTSCLNEGDQISTTNVAGPTQECGLSIKKHIYKKVIGGRPSGPNDWPWMVAFLTKKNLKHIFCGGVILTDRHILTAAHCFDNHLPNDVAVRLGEYDISKTTDNDPKDFNIAELRMHELYNSSTVNHDIAIIILDKPATFNKYIKPVCLPSAHPEARNQEHIFGFATGWGTVGFGRDNSNKLREVMVPEWEESDCSKAFPNLFNQYMLCAGLHTGGKDTCQGDSGGPFLTQKGNKWYVSGVTSFGIGCGRANSPGVYTRVSRYLSWIKETISL